MQLTGANRRQSLKRLVEFATWALFLVSVVLLARQTYFVVLGEPLVYANWQSALIVAGIVTLTWIVMLARLALGMDETPIDVIISMLLVIAGVGVDVAVGISVIFGWLFPGHLALLVIVGHVVAHVVQWLVYSIQKSLQRFSKNYVSEDEQVAKSIEDARRKEQQAREQLIAERTRSEMLRQFAQQTAVQNARVGEQAAQQKPSEIYTQACEDCGRVFKSETERGAINALNGHRPHCKGVPMNANGKGREV